MSGIIGSAGGRSGILGEKSPRFEIGTFTVGKESGGANLDSSSGGCYQLVGVMCTVNIRVKFDGSSDMVYNGLPFTSARRTSTATRENQNVGDVNMVYTDIDSQLFRIQTTSASNSHANLDTFEFSFTYPITGTDVG